MITGEDDWGWEWPLELVKAGWIERRRTGRVPDPERLANLPESWIAALNKLDALYEFYNAVEDDIGANVKEWSGHA